MCIMLLTPYGYFGPCEYNCLVVLNSDGPQGLLALGVHEGLVLLYSALPPACTSPLATAGRVFQLRTVLAVLTTPTNNMAALLAGPYWDMAYKILGEFPPEI